MNPSGQVTSNKNSLGAAIPVKDRLEINFVRVDNGYVVRLSGNKAGNYFMHELVFQTLDEAFGAMNNYLNEAPNPEETISEVADNGEQA